MSISEARQTSLLDGCNSLERKVFDYVPIQERWGADQINRQMISAGKSSTEYRRVRAALGGLKDRGLIKEVSRDVFQREQLKIRELREPVIDVPQKPKLGDFADLKALRRIAVPYVAPEPEPEPVAVVAAVPAPKPVPVVVEKIKNIPVAKPVVKEVKMNAIVKTNAEPTAANVALEALNEMSQEMDTLNDEFGSRMNKLVDEFGSRMGKLRDRIEVVQLEVEELRDAENKALEKFRAFKMLMNTLSED